VPLLPGFNWADFPALNRWAQLAIAELVSHGGSAEDARKLLAALKEQAAETENHSRSETIPE
jgi:hypothetical protein